MKLPGHREFDAVEHLVVRITVVLLLLIEFYHSVHRLLL